MRTHWTTADIPDQRGRVAVVTGANGGLGLVVARELARRGADVVLACRDAVKGGAAAAQILDAIPAAQLEVVPLDLRDVAAVRRACRQIAARHDRVDLLVNNAGVMATAKATTAGGVELQFATNHLGHFALTGLLLERLLSAPAARVVTVSSVFHRIGTVDAELLHRRPYRRWRAYARSKLANVLFGLELERRAAAAGTPLRSMTAHPGYAATKLQTAGFESAPARLAMAAASGAFAQSPYMGALPILYAATAPALAGGTFVGPGAAGGLRGFPRHARPAARARDPHAAARLWRASERLTGVDYDFAAAARG